jgi:hypothetical protein
VRVHYIGIDIRQEGRPDEPFRLVDFFRRGADHRGHHAGDRCDLGLQLPRRSSDGLQGAVLGHSLTTYGWIWLITGVILIAAGALLFGPGDRPASEISRWVGIIAASLGAISAAFVLPYYPVWSLLYVIISVMVGLRAIGSLRPEDGVTRSPWTLQARAAAPGGPVPGVRSGGWPTPGG